MKVPFTRTCWLGQADSGGIDPKQPSAIVIVPVSVAIDAIGFAFVVATIITLVTVAIVTAGYGIAGKSACHTADNRTPDTVRGQAADSSAANRTQCGAGVMTMAAASVREGRRASQSHHDHARDYQAIHGQPFRSPISHGRSPVFAGVSPADRYETARANNWFRQTGVQHDSGTGARMG
jgi:hypothetical protein